MYISLRSLTNKNINICIRIHERTAKKKCVTDGGEVIWRRYVFPRVTDIITDESELSSGRIY